MIGYRDSTRAFGGDSADVVPMGQIVGASPIGLHLFS